MLWMGLAKLSSVVYQDLQLFVSFGGSISGLLRILDFKWLPDKILMIMYYGYTHCSGVCLFKFPLSHSFGELH